MAEETEYHVEYGTRREPEILPIEVVVPESRTAEPVTETPRPSVVDSGYPKAPVFGQPSLPHKHFPMYPESTAPLHRKCLSFLSLSFSAASQQVKRSKLTQKTVCAPTLFCSSYCILSTNLFGDVSAPNKLIGAAPRELFELLRVTCCAAFIIFVLLSLCRDFEAVPVCGFHTCLPTQLLLHDVRHLHGAWTRSYGQLSYAFLSYILLQASCPWGHLLDSTAFLLNTAASRTSRRSSVRFAYPFFHSKYLLYNIIYNIVRYDILDSGSTPNTIPTLPLPRTVPLPSPAWTGDFRCKGLPEGAKRAVNICSGDFVVCEKVL